MSNDMKYNDAEMGGCCVKGYCIAGLIGTVPVAEKDWESAVADFDKVVELWNVATRRFAVPHPGFVHPAVFCIKCGRKL